jgi:hypothetical protein
MMLLVALTTLMTAPGAAYPQGLTTMAFVLEKHCSLD